MPTTKQQTKPNVNVSAKAVLKSKIRDLIRSNAFAPVQHNEKGKK